MNEYQLIVLEGLIEQRLAHNSNVKISMGFIADAMNYEKTSSKPIDYRKLQSYLNDELNKRSNKYANLDKYAYVVELVTDEGSFTISEQVECRDDNFVGYDIVVEDPNVIAATIRLNSDRDFCIIGSGVNWSSQVINRALKCIEEIIDDKDRVSKDWDFEEAVMGIIILMKYCIMDLGEKTNKITREQIMLCVKLAGRILQLAEKYYKDDTFTSNFDELNKLCTVHVLKHLITIIRAVIL